MTKNNVKLEDLRFETFNAGGNWFKNDAGVRLTHIPSGRVFESSESRTQSLNRNYCLNKLEHFLSTWKPNRVQYLIPTLYARDANEIARSYGLNPTQFKWVRPEEECPANHYLPKGYKADLSICVIKSAKDKHGSLDKVHRAWYEQLFDWLPEETQQKFFDRVGETLDGFLWCDRTWSAWGYGTMSQDDFSPAGNDDRVIYEHAVSMYITFLEMKL